MEYIQVTDDLCIYNEISDGYVVLATRDRESDDERWVCTALNKKDIEKLRKELGR